MTDQPTTLTPARYHLPAGYLEYEAGPAYFPDDGGDGIVHQPDVYPWAEALAELGGVGTIVDLGCGRADKLARIHDRHPEWDYVGVDHGPNIEWCKAHGGDWATWLERDLEEPQDLWQLAAGVIVDPEAVVIMADVLEHLRHPEHALDALKALRPRAVVISTPDRIRTWGPDHNGPPPNLCHVREWDGLGLWSFLEMEGFEVVRMFPTRADEQDKDLTTLLATVVVK